MVAHSFIHSSSASPISLPPALTQEDLGGLHRRVLCHGGLWLHGEWPFICLHSHVTTGCVVVAVGRFPLSQSEVTQRSSHTASGFRFNGESLLDLISFHLITLQHLDTRAPPSLSLLLFFRSVQPLEMSQFCTPCFKCCPSCLFDPSAGLPAVSVPVLCVSCGRQQ